MDEPNEKESDIKARSGKSTLLPDPELQFILKNVTQDGYVHRAISAFFLEPLTQPERVDLLAALARQILANPADGEELALAIGCLSQLTPAKRALEVRHDDPVDDWTLDEASWCLHTPLGHDVQLQRAEVAVLAKLFARPGINLPREELASSFKPDANDRNRSLDVVISKIRKKVRDISALEFPLRSIRGVGYVFTGRARLVAVVAGTAN